MKSTVRNIKQSTWWKDLCKIYNGANEGNLFDNNINWVLGDGHSIRLWEDRWIGGQSLKSRFSRLYSLTSSSGKVLSEVGQWKTREGAEILEWKLLWRRELFKWEKELKQQLESVLNNAQWKRIGSDGWL